MHQLALLMMGCFLGVLGVGIFFACLIRHHNRQQARLGRRPQGYSRLPPGLAASLHAACPLPPRWIAIRSSNGPWVRNFLGLGGVVPWSEALGRVQERRLFLSPPVHGWMLLVGGALPDPAQDVDALFRCLQRLSAEVGEVQFFAADRVLDFHGWARFRDGRAQRAYAWAGEVVWNQGVPTPEERQLDLRCRDYGDAPPEARFGEASPEQANTERVPLLARRWSLDFGRASELLLVQEGIGSPGDGDDGDAPDRGPGGRPG